MFNANYDCIREFRLSFRWFVRWLSTTLCVRRNFVDSCGRCHVLVNLMQNAFSSAVFFSCNSLYLWCLLMFHQANCTWFFDRLTDGERGQSETHKWIYHKVINACYRGHDCLERNGKMIITNGEREREMMRFKGRKELLSANIENEKRKRRTNK